MLSKGLLAASVALPLLSTSAAWAEGGVISESSLEQRVAVLESRSKLAWPSTLSFSGALEVEAGYRDQAGEQSSDVAVATVELGLDAQVNGWTSAHVLLLHEEDDTPVAVDEALIVLGNSEHSPWYLQAGQFYLPFGRFDSYMISDPLTLEVAEIRESAIQLGAASDHWYTSVFFFNGSTSEGDEDRIEHYGADAGVLLSAGESRLDIGVSYLSSLGDTDGLDMGSVDEFVAGVAIHGLVETGSLALMGEYVTALDDLAGADSQVSAMNLEAAYTQVFGGQDVTLALAHQRTEETVGIDLPSERLMFALSTTLWADADVSIEWANDEFEGTSDTANTLTLQLATRF